MRPRKGQYTALQLTRKTPTHRLKASALLHRPALEIGSFPKGSRLLQGDKSLVAVIVSRLRAVQEAVKVEVEASVVAVSVMVAVSVAGVEGSKDINLALRRGW